MKLCSSPRIILLCFFHHSRFFSPTSSRSRRFNAGLRTMAKLWFTWTSRGPDRYARHPHHHRWVFLLFFFFHIEVAASRFVTLQRLSINVAAVSTAENMMDLIDGYCRLEHDTDETVIYRPNKGASGLDCLLYQQNPS